MKLSFSSITTALLIGFALLMYFSPTAKGLVIQGLMKIGLFQPDIKENKRAEDINALTPAIVFKDSAENSVNLSDLKGKVVFINFWATWCPPCRAEMPSIEHLYQQFKNDNDVVFLMVDVDNNYINAKKFMDRKNYTLPVYTMGSSVPKNLMSGTIPTTLILDKKGQLVFKQEGATDFTNKDIQNYLKTLSK